MINSYDIIRPIGKGGMAEVFLARWQRMGAQRYVAIKKLLPHLADNPELATLFQKEIQYSVLLEHENIVRVYDAGLDETIPYLVMEYINGCNLSSILHNGALSAAQACSAGASIAKALTYAHSNSPALIHGDVSPQNILISQSGQVKLADFGISRVESQATQPLQMRGKLAYMAPELFSGSKTNKATDQFSLGLVNLNVRK